MISEVLNAIFLTYLATEYQVSHNRRDGRLSSSLLLRPRLLLATVALTILNVLDRVSGAAHVANDLIQGVLHVPKILLVAILYVLALYLDCRQQQVHQPLETRKYLRILLHAFLQVLPVYPLLAIAISFGFLILINVFEVLHLSLDILNMPIYYGTLYGPFSLVYYKVKRRYVEDNKTSLLPL
jgi:hypothetical protein